jgi:hypothetical protein
MNAALKEISEKAGSLSPRNQAEVLDFIEFLAMKKKMVGKSVKLRQDWAGALRKYKGKFSSIELQKKALLWRVK